MSRVMNLRFAVDVTVVSPKGVDTATALEDQALAVLEEVLRERFPVKNRRGDVLVYLGSEVVSAE